MAAALPADVAAALRYGPQTQQAIRRSQYLADALKQLGTAGAENIRSPGELAAKLLATAILHRANDKAKDATSSAIKADMDTEASALISALRPQKPPAQEAPPDPAATAPRVNTPPKPQPVLAAPLPPAPPQQVAALDENFGRSAVASILPGAQVTSGFRTPERNAAVGGVENSFHTRGGGQAVDFVPPPGADLGQFRAELERRGLPVAELLNEGDHWHWAYGGQAPTNPPPPSAPGSSPSAVGTAPAAPLPQAQGAAGATPQWPTYQPSEREIAFVESLLRDPRTHEQGRAEAMKLRQKMSQPAPAKIVEMNGLQFYVPETPTPGAAPVMIPVPQEAMTQNLPAESAGVAAPRGTIISRDPYNNIRPVIQPPTGQQVLSNPGEPYREGPVPGGQNDPFRVQAPPTGYQYQGGAQQPIPGGPADPRSATNVAAAAQQYRDMAKTVVDDALKVKKNFEAVRTGFAQQNGPGDVVIVNGLQRLIDEGVVRGEDIRTLAQSMGLQGTVDSWTNYLQSGGAFDPAMRKKLYTIAEQLYRKADDVYRARLMGLQPGFDELYGPGNFSKFVFPQTLAEQLGWNRPEGPPAPDAVAAPQFKPGTPDAALAEAVRRGLRLSPQQQQRARDLGLIQ